MKKVLTNHWGKISYLIYESKLDIAGSSSYNKKNLREGYLLYFHFTLWALQVAFVNKEFLCYFKKSLKDLKKQHITIWSKVFQEQIISKIIYI